MKTDSEMRIVLQKDKANQGVTLAYSGMHFGPSSFNNNKFISDAPNLRPLDALTKSFH